MPQLICFDIYSEENRFCCRGQENQKEKYNTRFEYWGEHFASSKLYHFPLLEKEAEAISSNSKAYW